MGVEINVNPSMLTWAVARAGIDLQDFVIKFPKIQSWIDQTKKPTLKQLEAFSKMVHIPFGYLFLPEPPVEEVPIPYFRTITGDTSNVSLNVYDTILLMQQRQDWLREYLQNLDFPPLPFVGLFGEGASFDRIVESIRSYLSLEENWATSLASGRQALDMLAQRIEGIGINIVFNGVVENNNTRPISVHECRGFVLVDPIAPFMFINNADAKSAQLFTIIHELAHIWLGKSAAFDFRQMLPANDPIELLCDQVAAEFLVPRYAFSQFWERFPDITRASRNFKVSEIVIARRALDLGFINKSFFFRFYEEYTTRELQLKESRPSGGDFYLTTKKRLGMNFATHINNAVNAGYLLHRDAYRLTSLRGDTFQTFFTKHFIAA